MLQATSPSQFANQVYCKTPSRPSSSLRRAEVTKQCILVDILAFAVFSALSSPTPPSDIQAGPLGHTGRPDIQTTV